MCTANVALGTPVPSLSFTVSFLSSCFALFPYSLCFLSLLFLRFCFFGFFPYKGTPEMPSATHWSRRLSAPVCVTCSLHFDVACFVCFCHSFFVSSFCDSRESFFSASLLRTELSTLSRGERTIRERKKSKNANTYIETDGVLTPPDDATYSREMVPQIQYFKVCIISLLTVSNFQVDKLEVVILLW